MGNKTKLTRSHDSLLIAPALIMKWTGKMLELIGMVVVAAGFLYGVQYSLVRFELGALAIGSLIFYVGWLIEKRT